MGERERVARNEKEKKKTELKKDWGEEEQQIGVRYRPPRSYDGLVRRLLQQLGGEQGMLGRVHPLGVGDEQADLLIGSSPLGVQLAVVAE